MFKQISNILKAIWKITESLHKKYQILRNGFIKCRLAKENIQKVKRTPGLTHKQNGQDLEEQDIVKS